MDALIHLLINDVSGKVIMSNIYYNVDIIEIENIVLSSGLYIISLTDSDGNITQNKLLVK